MFFRRSIPKKLHFKPGLPILFVHTGLSSGNPEAELFLNMALRQAVLASPGNDVILLTDLPRPDPSEIIQIRLADFRVGACRFERIYRHTSVSSLDYERFCFARWFYIREFVQRHGIERFCILDSDILLFSPIESFVAEFDGYQAGNWAWANVVTAAALELMCDGFERFFRDSRLRALVADKYRVGHTPHLSDMIALFEMAAGNPAFLNQNKLPARGFDDNINTSMSGFFVMDGRRKLLKVRADGVPVARRSADGAEVPFHFLHFQGDAKSLMVKYAWHDRI